MTNVVVRPLFTIEFETAAQIIGNVPMGYFRRSAIITAGRFVGDRVSGKALAGGGDWLIKRAKEQPTIRKLRKRHGTEDDDELILRALVKEPGLEKMRAAGAIERE